MLAGGFLTDFDKMVADWAVWATRLAEQWPDDPSAAKPTEPP